jgi:hypothetical protein
MFITCCPDEGHMAGRLLIVDLGLIHQHMEDFKKAEDLVEHVREYVHVRMDEARLGLAERSSGVIATLVSGVTLAAMFAFSFLFIGVAAALLLGRVLDDLVLGFLLVASFDVLLGMIIWWCRKSLIRTPVMNMLLEELFERKNGHEKKVEHGKN